MRWLPHPRDWREVEAPDRDRRLGRGRAVSPAARDRRIDPRTRKSDDEAARVASWNGGNRADRYGDACRSTQAMQHSGGADLTPASTVSHELLSSKHKSSSLRRHRPDCFRREAAATACRLPWLHSTDGSRRGGRSLRSRRRSRAGLRLGDISITPASGASLLLGHETSEERVTSAKRAAHVGLEGLGCPETELHQLVVFTN
jgi:hypothetical protein